MPRKKRAIVDDDEEDCNPENEGESDVESEQHTPKRATRKRVQIASPAAAKETEQRVNDEEMVVDEQASPEGLKYRAGTISYIELQNFLCHAHLKLDMNKRINFVTGPNGSGKSAILAAIQTAFGARASSTTRAAKNSDLIKRGCSFARVILRLRNEGPDAYRPEIFGMSIVIEKKLVESGVGDYKIRNGDTNKITELKMMLDQFGIQVDNPCTVLTQDVSKTYLTSTTPADKYTFFAQTTRISDIQKDLGAMKRDIDIMKQYKEDKNESIKDMEETYKRALERYEKTAELRLADQELHTIQGKIAWARVQSDESRIGDMKNDVDRMIENRAKLEEKAKLRHDLAKKAEAVKAELDTQLKSCMQNMDPKNAEIQALGNRQDQLTREVKLIAGSLEPKKRDKAKHLKHIKDVEDAINKIVNSSNSSAARQRESEKRMADIRRLEDEKRNREQEMAECENEMRGIDQDIEREQHTLQEHSRDEGRTKQDISNYESYLRKLTADKTDALAPYLDNVRKTYDLIERNARQFKFKPVGPIGSQVQLSDPTYKIPAEIHLENLFPTYLVSNADDQRTLLKLDSNASVVIQPVTDRRHNLNQSNNRPPQGKYTILSDILTSEKPIVFNAMVDMRNTESVVCVKSVQEVRDMLRNTDFTTYRFSDVYSPEGYHGTMRNNVDITTQLETANAKRYGKIQSNSADQVDNIRRDIQEAKNKLQDMAAHITTIKRRIDELKTRRSGADQRRSNARRASDTARSQIQRLQDEEDRARAVPSDDQQFEAMDAEIVSTRSKIDTVQNEINAQEKRITDLNAEVESLKQQIINIKDSMDTDNRSMETLASQIERAASEMSKHKEAFESYNKEVNACAAHLDRFKEAIKTHEGTLAENIALAERVCASRLIVMVQLLSPRVTVTKTVEALEKDQVRLQRIVREGQQTMGDTNAITADYLKKKDAYTSAVNDMNAYSKLISELSQRYDERIGFLEYYKTRIAERVNMNMTRILSSRGATCHFDVDYPEEKLHFAVYMTEAQKKAADAKRREAAESESKKKYVESVGALSGGEKSYSTVSLLLSLWNSVDPTPFRALDEFDVFMDNINRRLVMEMLINFTKHHAAGTQFIFITPLGLDHVPQNDPDVCVYTLADPINQ